MPTMKIEMTIPKLQSFIATNRVNIEWREDAIYHIKEGLKDWYEELNDWMQNNPNSKDYPDGIENCIHFIKEDKRELKQHRRDLAHYVKLQIAAKKALRKAYEDQREAVIHEANKREAEFIANNLVLSDSMRETIKLVEEREAIKIDLINEALRMNRERAEYQKEFVANIIVC